ncbi:DHHA1 domain-containing protein [Nanoarchaeota archaeon]
MALTKKQIEQIRKELDECNNPLFFFDDDADGLCSFLLLYRHKQEGKGVPMKTLPVLGMKLFPKIEEYSPDKIFVLDIPMIDQEFLDEIAKLKIPVIWIDHHGPYEREHVKYFNPRVDNPEESPCVTSICYEVVDEPEDLWLAAIGIVADWQFMPILDDFSKKYSDLLPAEIKKPEDALFASKLGKFVKIFSFILKGKLSEVYKCVKILTRIKDPYEILEKKTAQGKYIYDKYQEVNSVYDELLNEAKAQKPKDNVLKYIYDESNSSFTKELSNELLYLHPDNVILVARDKSGEIKMSLRSSKHNLKPALQKALVGVEGYGGGHEHASGACVKKEDFEVFLEQLKEALKEQE